MKSFVLALTLFSAYSQAIAISTPSVSTVNSTASVQDVSGFFQAWSGNYCDGGEGGAIGVNYPGGTDCVDTYGRHSFFVGNGPCKRYNLILFENQGCNGRWVLQNNDPGCENVNLGMSWESAKIVCTSE
jgi:hypothetical protein